jgi:hypothetical protein
MGSMGPIHEKGRADEAGLSPLVDCLAGLRLVGAGAQRIGCELLLGFVQRLRREMEVLNSRKHEWFSAASAGTHSVWHATVSLAWQTVACAIDFLVVPPAPDTSDPAAPGAHESAWALIDAIVRLIEPFDQTDTPRKNQVRH